MCRLVCKEAGLGLEIVPVEWFALPTAFEEQDLDLVLSVFETQQRQQYAAFTAAFYSVGVGGVTLEGDRQVTSLDDLAREEIKIVVTKGEVGWEYAVHELEVPRRRLIVIENANLVDMVDPILSGRAAVALCDSISCDAIARTDPRLRHSFREHPLYLCKNSIMLPKGETGLSQWIVDRFRLARKSEVIQAGEKEILAGFDGLLRRFT